jgi:hypothetical protein
MGKLGRLGQQPTVRYERERPGELVHIDIKKSTASRAVPANVTGRLGRGRRRVPDSAGVPRGTVCWARPCISQSTRRDAWPTPRSSATRSHRCHRFSTPRDRVLRASRHHRRARTDQQRVALPLEHPRDHSSHPRRPPPAHPPLPPADQSKAERFIRTMLGDWPTTPDRRLLNRTHRALDGWLWEYGHRPRHQALGRQTPITRLNNLLGSYN